MIGTWAGPRSSGTGYVMLHHNIGGVDGQAGAWGFSRGGMGGRPSSLPFADICIPSVFDDSLAPEGHHVTSMFTQWVPCGFADNPDEAALACYADRVIARMEAVARGFTDSVLHRQVIGPHQMQ